MKIILSFIFSIYFLFGKSQNFTSLKLTNIKSTLIEAGVFNPSYKVDDFTTQYKKAKFLYSSSNKILIIKNKIQSDSIFISKLKKSRQVIDNIILQRYPDDNLEKCIEDSLSICQFSKMFRKILNINSTCIYYSNGFQINYKMAYVKRYLLFYLQHENIALYDFDNSIILFLKKYQ